MSDKKDQQVQTAIRVPESLLERAEKLAERIAQPGRRCTRADVLRLAAFRGIAELEAENKRK